MNVLSMICLVEEAYDPVPALTYEEQLYLAHTGSVRARSDTVGFVCHVGVVVLGDSHLYLAYLLRTKYHRFNWERGQVAFWKNMESGERSFLDLQISRLGFLDSLHDPDMISIPSPRH